MHMSERKEFSLMTGGVEGEYWKNEESNKVIIFSHGFGVTRDARGMFTELARLVEGNHTVVFFDYADVDENGNTTTFPFSEQTKKLEAVIEFAREQFSSREMDIVAHSQGCIIVGLVSPDDVSKIILVAGPISAPGENMKEYFSQREGAVIDEEGTSELKRSDGTLTFVPSEYWKGANEVNPAEMFLALAKKSKVYFVRAKQDQVVTGEDYSQIINSKITFIELDGNHDFEGGDRKQWLTKMTELLKE